MSGGKIRCEHDMNQEGPPETDHVLVGDVKGMPDGEVNKFFQTLSDPEKEAVSGLAGAHVAHGGARPDQGVTDDGSLAGELDSD